jgi:hypothetical protein
MGEEAGGRRRRGGENQIRLSKVAPVRLATEKTGSSFHPTPQCSGKARQVSRRPNGECSRTVIQFLTPRTVGRCCQGHHRAGTAREVREVAETDERGVRRLSTLRFRLFRRLVGICGRPEHRKFWGALLLRRIKSSPSAVGTEQTDNCSLKVWSWFIRMCCCYWLISAAKSMLEVSVPRLH